MMGVISHPTLVKHFCGIISAYEQIVNDAEKNLIECFGPVDLKAGPIKFDFTDYYTPQMGQNLQRYFISFNELIDPGRLADIKVMTNTIEEKYAAQVKEVDRPINLDPGYVTAANMVLASTKNYVHRIYIGNGIYAELEYIFGKNKANFFKWTYPDYRTEKYVEFFIELRKKYLLQLKELRKSK
jgi:hypothetical protein